MARGAQLELTASYTASNTRNSFVLTGTDPFPVSDEHAKSQILSFDAKLDGNAFSLPTGDVRYAVGGQFRREEFDYTDLLGMSEFDPSQRSRRGIRGIPRPPAGAQRGGGATARVDAGGSVGALQ